MDGIGVPILGLCASAAFFVLSLAVPCLRRFAMAAVAAPFLSSIVLLLGSFVLADMNPAREYGEAYMPTGREHNPTTLDFALLFLAVAATFVIVAAACVLCQRLILRTFRKIRGSADARLSPS
jgi:hypothetical protein